MLPLEADRAAKRGFVIAALDRQGLALDVAETIGVDTGSRRRAVLTALRAGARVILGYHERLSQRLVDIEECPVLAPALSSRLAGLRTLLAPLLPQRKPVRITALVTAAGLDVVLDGTNAPAPARLTQLVEAARTVGVARLTVGGETVLTLAEPVIDVSGVPLVPPPGAFVQASAAAEAAMVGLVVDHLGHAKRIADLFSGVGTFALALARHAAVQAVEENAAALEALSLALRRANNLRPVTTLQRDLQAHPLSPQELAHYGAVVFDPPRSGAKAQAASLAASSVPLVAAVSCNPASFARDTRILIDGGYQANRIVPVDQFVYSAETEVVGLFSRP
jgi:23S rRNA (uracil1939-C5)-methyltransferase